MMTKQNSLIVAVIAAVVVQNTYAFTTPTPSKSVISSTKLNLDFGNLFGGDNKNSNLNPFAPSDDKSTKTSIIAGATGYIGKSTVRESVRQGYNTIALVRDESKVTSPEGKALYGQFFEGAKIVECDVCDSEALTKVRIKLDITLGSKLALI